MIRRAVVLALVVAAVGCPRSTTGPPAVPRLSDDRADDAGAISVDALATMVRAPNEDFRQEIVLSVQEEVSGRGFSGRGAVAVRPKRALRMILLGPGGTTAMDVWISDARWRVSIPPMDRIFRSENGPAEVPRGLPIPLLRRWLVDPWGGTPVAAHRGRANDDGAIVDDPTAFVAFLKRPDVFEVRVREASTDPMRARAWWLVEGKVVAWLEGSERATAEPNGPILPTSAHYVSIDPPMTVDVTVGAATLARLDDATFDDPDALH